MPMLLNCKLVKIDKMTRNSPSPILISTFGMFLRFPLSVNGDKNYNINTDPLPMNEWSKLVVRQQEVGSLILYEILLNNILIKSVVNTDLREFTDAKVFASNPARPSQDGEIRIVSLTFPGRVLLNILSIAN